MPAGQARRVPMQQGLQNFLTCPRSVVVLQAPAVYSTSLPIHPRLSTWLPRNMGFSRTCLRRSTTFRTPCFPRIVELKMKQLARRRSESTEDSGAHGCHENNLVAMHFFV